MDQRAFFWKGRDSQGNIQSVQVAAENAQAARKQLAEAGWTELELVKDEIATAAGQRVEAPDWMKQEPLTADQEVAFFEGRGPGILEQWWAGLKQSGTTILICAALLGWGIYRGHLWPVIIGAICLAVLILLAPALHWFFGLASREYSRLNRAKIWGRWNEMLDCVERLRRNHRLTRIGLNEVELARNRAQALAGLGRLEEGINEFKQYEHSSLVEHWLYLSHLSGIYDVAKAYEKSLECRRQAANEKPETSAVWIDVAYGLVRGLNRPVEAREALARAEALEVTGLGKAYLPFLRGLICWREGRATEAKQNFEQALVAFQPLAKHDLVQGLILLTKSHLCAVQNALGNKADAQKLFQQVEKFLVANREDELLRACRAA